MHTKSNGNYVVNAKISSDISNSSRHPTVVSRKVALLGFRAVGKSCLTNSFLTGTFSPIYDPTIESTYHKTIRFRKVHFTTDIVDTAGMVCLRERMIVKDAMQTTFCDRWLHNMLTNFLFVGILSHRMNIHDYLETHLSEFTDTY